LKNNKVAVDIKIADIIDNLTDTIIIVPPSMVERYEKSLEILID